MSAASRLFYVVDSGARAASSPFNSPRSSSERQLFDPDSFLGALLLPILPLRLRNKDEFIVARALSRTSEKEESGGEEKTKRQTLCSARRGAVSSNPLRLQARIQFAPLRFVRRASAKNEGKKIKGWISLLCRAPAVAFLCFNLVPLLLCRYIWDIKFFSLISRIIECLIPQVQLPLSGAPLLLSSVTWLEEAV